MAFQGSGLGVAVGEDDGEGEVVAKVLEVVSEFGVGFLVDVVQESASDAGCGHADVGTGVGCSVEFRRFPDGVDALAVTREFLDLGAGERSGVAL